MMHLLYRRNLEGIPETVRITDGAVVSADLIRSWSTRISLIK